MFRRSAEKIDLPSMPAVLAKIIEVSRSADPDPEKLAQAVMLDQSLAARVLRLANSAYFFRREKAETVTDAILTLGFGYVRNLAASATVIESLFPQRTYPSFSWLNMWTHCVTCAVASESIYAAMTGTSRKSDEAVFIAGLMHDVGKMLLAQVFPKKFFEITEMCREHDMEMIDAEYNCLSTDHARAGSSLMYEWCFPDKLNAGVTYHHHPDRAPQYEEVATAVCAGNMLAKKLSEPYILGAKTSITLQNIGGISKLDMQDLGMIIGDVRDGVLRCSEIVCWGLDLPNWQHRAA